MTTETLTPPAMSPPSVKPEARPNRAAKLNLAPYEVGSGSVVMWIPPGEPNSRLPALVRRKNADGTLCLTVFNNSPHPDTTREAAYHIDDERVASEPHRVSRYGRWDYSPEGRAILALQEAVKALSK